MHEQVLDPAYVPLIVSWCTGLHNELQSAALHPSFEFHLQSSRARVRFLALFLDLNIFARRLAHLAEELVRSRAMRDEEAAESIIYHFIEVFRPLILELDLLRSLLLCSRIF